MSTAVPNANDADGGRRAVGQHRRRTGQFPLADSGERGYRRDDVDRYFARMRALWEAWEPGVSEPPPENGSRQLSSSAVRAVRFKTARRGYRMQDVDDALDRLEDAIAQRERGAGLLDDERAAQRRDELIDVVRARLEQLDGDRFARARRRRLGYAVGDVDAFCERLRTELDETHLPTVADLRELTFAAEKGEQAYDGASVDAFIDQLIELARYRA